MFRGLLSVQLALRPACSRSRPRRPFPSKASTVLLPPLPLRLLPAGATSCRVGIAPTEDLRLFTAHIGAILGFSPAIMGLRDFVGHARGSQIPPRPRVQAAPLLGP